MALNPHAPPFSLGPNQDPNQPANMQHSYMMQPQGGPPQGYGQPPMQSMGYMQYPTQHETMYQNPNAPYGQGMAQMPPQQYKNPRNPMHAPRNAIRPPRQFSDGGPYFHQQQQQQHQHQQQQQQPRAQPVQAPSVPPQQPSFARKIIMVCGYRYSGKTTVAQAIAKERNYLYISLAPQKSDDEEDYEMDAVTRFNPLIDALKKPFTGLVLDDVICFSKYDAYYVNHMVQSAGHNINVVVMLECELDTVKKRGEDVYSFSSSRILHPESYEFSATCIDPPTVVYAGGSVEETVKDALAKVHADLQTGAKIIPKPVELIPRCPLVTDRALVTAIVSAQAKTLGISSSVFPYSEPNYLLEYPTFARKAFQFAQYMVTPWVDGDKVAVVGYNGKVYVHLHSYEIVFELKDVPVALAALLNDPQATNTTEPSTPFSFAATILDNVIYISELLYVGDKVCTKMELYERVDMLKQVLGNVPQDSNVRVLQWFPVSEVQECIDTYASLPIAGVILTNPRPMKAGAYDSFNFPFPLEDKKRVSLRIWGSVASDDDAIWCFEAYGRVEGEDSIVQNRLVIIPDVDVTAFCINDGNIVECECEEIPAQPTRGKKAGRHPGYRYKFIRRRNWMLEPDTLHLEEVCSNARDWPQKRFVEACKSIAYCPPYGGHSCRTSENGEEGVEG